MRTDIRFFKTLGTCHPQNITKIDNYRHFLRLAFDV